MPSQVLGKSSSDQSELRLHSLVDTTSCREAVCAVAGLMVYLENHMADSELVDR